MTKPNRLGYITVSKKQPFFTIYVQVVKLNDVTTSGATGLSVTRLGDTAPCANYSPLLIDTNANSFQFAINSLVTSKAGGRYQGVLTYKGTVLGTFPFVFDKPNPVLVGA